MNISDWREKQKTASILIPLPSGLEIRAKKKRSMAFFVINSMPHPLADKVLASEGTEQSEVKENISESEKNLRVAKKIQETISEIVLFPKIVFAPNQNPGDGEIHLSELDDDDLATIMKYINFGTLPKGETKAEAEKLEPFRNGAGSPVTGPALS